MGLQLSELSKGDRVVICKTSHYYGESKDNPDASITGTVDIIGTTYAHVKWDNGTTNSYSNGHLEKMTSSLTKYPIVGKWYTNPEWSRGSIAKYRSDFPTSREFTFSECMYPSNTSPSKVNSSWSMYDGVRLVTTDELRRLPKDHPDNPDYTGSEFIIGRWYVSKHWSSSSIAKCSKDASTRGLMYFEEAYIGRTIRTSSSWDAQDARLALDDELAVYLPEDHIDNPKRVSTKDSKRGTPIGTYTPKTGDKVKVIADRAKSGATIGDTGIVGNVYRDHCAINSDHCAIKMEGKTYTVYNYFDDLEYISSEPKTVYNFKEGDKIRIIANTNSHGLKEGETAYLKGYKETSSKGGYYWNVQPIERRVIGVSVRECDMELVTTKLPSIDLTKYRLKSKYESRDKIYIRLIRMNHSEFKTWTGSTVERVKSIPLGTIMSITGDNMAQAGNFHPENNKYSFNFPRDWFEILGVHVDEIPKASTYAPTTLDPVSSTPKVWRVKTREEMISDGIMSPTQDKPAGWSDEMTIYFGTIIDPKHYSDIDSCKDDASHLWCGKWWVYKRELTTKLIPTKSFWEESSDDESDEDYDEDDILESSSWEYKIEEGVYDSDLDRLDAMSKSTEKDASLYGHAIHTAVEKWFAETPEAWPDMDMKVSSRRPTKEVEVIPHRSRKIF